MGRSWRPAGEPAEECVRLSGSLWDGGSLSSSQLRHSQKREVTCKYLSIEMQCWNVGKMFIFRCVSHSVQRNLRDYITLKTIRKLNIHILSSNSTGYIESFLNDSQIEGENLRFCQGIPHDVLRLRWTERMFIRCLTAQCEEIYRLFCYFAQGGNSYISSLVTALTVRCEV